MPANAVYPRKLVKRLLGAVATVTVLAAVLVLPRFAADAAEPAGATTELIHQGPAPGRNLAVVADTTPPTTPGTPAVSSSTAGSAVLTWTASTDNVGVVGYDVVRVVNGTTDVPFTTTTAPTVTVPNGGDVVNVYAVYARDAAGNRSARSGPVTVFPTGGDQPPTAPGAPIAANVTATSADITWAPSTDNVGVIGYNLYRRQGTTDTLLKPVSTNATTLTGLTPATSYTLVVRALDAAGNASLTSPPGTFVTLQGGDTSPPTPPGSLAATGVTLSSATVSWTAATDNVGVTGYDVVRVQGATETAIGTATTTSLVLTALTPCTSYTIGVYARDAAGNRSTRATVTFTTLCPPATCKVTYALNDWGNGGFGVNLTILNTGSTAINGWTLRFAFPGNQQVGQGWSATWSQTGAAVTATSLSWNATLAPNASTSIGFNGSYTGANPRPTAFTVNNNPCTIG